jgi:hypothetical protein
LSSGFHSPGAPALLRSFRNLATLDAGFDRNQVLVVDATKVDPMVALRND